MGQHSSSAGGPVPCCTSRGDDEARPDPRVARPDPRVGAETREYRASPRRSLRNMRGERRDDSFEVCDGGTGGTGSAGREKPRRDDDSMCSASRFGLTCVENRDADFDAGRKALFGERALKPKLQRLRATEAEVEALMKTITSIERRLPKQKGSPIALPAALEAGSYRMSDIELVRRLRIHEECLAGVGEGHIKEACARVMKALAISGGTGSPAERPLEKEEIKKHYADILANIMVLLGERISRLNEQKAVLAEQVKDVETTIETCFDKMLEDDSGTVDSDTFVTFLCEMDTTQHDFAISPQDAENLFNQMSEDGKELTYDQFKDEVTVGCLNVMQQNMEIRREMSKQYRDTCI